MPVGGSVESRDGVADRGKVIDDDEPLDAELLLHQGRSDHPRVVGELEQLAADRSRERDRQLLRQRTVDPPAELLPGMLEARELAGLDGDWLAKLRDSSLVNRRQREPRMGATDIGRRNSSHHFPSWRQA